MGGLTLPFLHPSIPSVIRSPDGQRMALSVLRNRFAAGLPVKGLRAPDPSTAVKATIESYMKLRGPLADDIFQVLVALDEEGYYGDGSDFSGDGPSFAIYPNDDMPAFRFVGPAIDLLEGLTPGLGETVLSTISFAERVLPGVLSAASLESLFSMMTWGELDSSASDEVAHDVLLNDMGYSEDSLPMLPSQFRTAMGGSMWLTPQPRLSPRQLTRALGSLDKSIARPLATIVTRDLPTVCREIQQTPADLCYHGAYCTQLVVVRSEEGLKGISRLLDDLFNDRMNSGDDGALFRCQAEPTEQPSRPPRAQKGPRSTLRAPRLFDSAAAVAAVMRGYHLLNRLLQLLETLELQHT